MVPGVEPGRTSAILKVATKTGSKFFYGELNQLVGFPLFRSPINRVLVWYISRVYVVRSIIWGVGPFGVR